MVAMEEWHCATWLIYKLFTLNTSDVYDDIVLTQQAQRNEFYRRMLGFSNIADRGASVDNRVVMLNNIIKIVPYTNLILPGKHLCFFIVFL